MNKKTLAKILLSLSLALSVLSFSAHAGSHSGSEEVIIEVKSSLGFKETIAKLRSNAKALGWKVPKKWAKNFQKNLKHVTKVDIGKNLVIEMCEPHAAVDLLIHDQYKKFLAMMPCSIAVYEKSDGGVYISMMNINMLGKMFPGKEVEALVAKLGPQMDKMLIMK